VSSGFIAGQSALVLGFHGAQGTGTRFEGASLIDKAEKTGFATVFPDATNPPGNTGIWQFDGTDAGSTRLWTQSNATPPDDMGFIRHLIAVVQAGIHPDPNRIYATGFSVGAFFAHRVGIELSDVVAAVGIVEGSASESDPATSPDALAPVSVIVLHGTSGLGGMCGNVSSIPYSSVASQDAVFKYWTGSQTNHCATVRAGQFCTATGGSLTANTIRTATSCQKGTEVASYELAGGTHQWYDTPMNNPAVQPYNSSFTNPLPGITTDDILWNFFAAHPKLPAPSVTLAAIVSAASYAPATVSPGEIVALTGSDIGPTTLTMATIDPATGRVATILAGARVMFDSVPGPLVYVSANQVSAIVPYEVAGKAFTSVQVEINGRTSAPLLIPVVDAVPGLFSANASGRGQGAILNQDASYNSNLNPARTGDIIVLFGTGEGQTIPPGVSGQIAAVSIPKPVLPVSVSIGGLTAEVTYYGSAPNSVTGLFQVNARLPPGIPPGDQPVTLTVGSARSQPNLTVAVQ
jgi:uncharacterized protein (TIGR03437 family)